MKKRLIKTIFYCKFLFLLSCVNDTFDTPPSTNCIDPGLSKNKSIKELYKMAINPEIIPPGVIPNTPTYLLDDIIEGYIISSDEGGNFYKNIYLQSLDGSKGVNISIDERYLYSKFAPGKKVFLKLKGLAFANPKTFGRGLIFGALPTDRFVVNRISTYDYPNHLINSCDSINEDALIHKINIDQVGEAYLNTLVELNNVQFTGESVDETFDLIRNDEYDSSTFITQNGSKNLAIRTSKYANFAGHKTPKGNGKIRGVLTQYNTIYQLILRTEQDVKFNNPRIDYQLPLGGTNIQYQSTFSENFSSYETSKVASTFPKYINDAYKGGKYWTVGTFRSNKFVQMSAYNSGGTNISFLALPVAFEKGKKLSFKTRDGYYKGSVLNVYYSKDYVPGTDFKKATLFDITSHFNISKENTSGYASAFTSSGNYTIPDHLSGNGFFIFEYNTAGRANVTTTIQIDDIVVN